MKTFTDERGTMFFNFFDPPFEIKQCFTSLNHKNVLRGMHFSPYEKFITLTSGHVLDVVVSPEGLVKYYTLKTGDCLHVPANHGHGYFCFEETTINYFLAGVYDHKLEKNCHWKDPTLKIEWPDESKYAIVSEKDESNELFKPIETLILGSSGFLGSELLKYIPNSVGTTRRLEDIGEELSFIKPKYVVSAAGISGKPTINWCESHKEETTHTNLTEQLQLIHTCKKLGIHLTILGSAFVYEGEKYFTEEDKPNNHEMFYSHTRILLEDVIKSVHSNDVLYLRIIYPLSGNGHEKCFLEKLKSRKNNIHNANVSLTVIPSLFPTINGLIKQKLTGIFNFTNEGSTTLSQILIAFDVKHTISNEKSNRGECKLDVSKLQKHTSVENIPDALNKISTNYKNV